MTDSTFTTQLREPVSAARQAEAEDHIAWILVGSLAPSEDTDALSAEIRHYGLVDQRVDAGPEALARLDALIERKFAEMRYRQSHAQAPRYVWGSTE